MNYLTPEQVLFIHARVIAETGGEHSVRDLSMLLSAVGRPQATFDKHDLYPDIFSKAGALLESLVGNHAFVDGNKRTAIISAGLLLLINGYRLTASNQELEEFTLKCAQHMVTFEQMVLWLRIHSTDRPIAIQS